MWAGISCLTSDKAAGTRYLTLAGQSVRRAWYGPWGDQFAGWQCGSEYYYELASPSLGIVSCQWLILSDSCSGLEKTEQWSPAGWQGPQSGPYTARPREAESWSAGQRRQTLHNQQHHPECQIYAYDVSYRAWWMMDSVHTWKSLLVRDGVKCSIYVHIS